MDLTNVRFGYGYGPRRPAMDAAEALAHLSGPDVIARRYPLPERSVLDGLAAELRAAIADRRAGADGADDRMRDVRTRIRAGALNAAQTRFARMIDTDDPVRERLTAFWADHLTVIPTFLMARALHPYYVESVIRPHITAPFATMLKAMVRDPSMLSYLDQARSVGPASTFGQRSGRGLNENFARELLELHSLGVDGGYSQSDVRATAELLAGLTTHRDGSFRFLPAWAQPGPIAIFGRSYGGHPDTRLDDIDSFLEDLAIQPSTARHLARKLAVHFVSDEPTDALVQDLEAIYRETGGDLAQVTAVLVQHPDAHAMPLQKVKQPGEFIASVLLSFGMTGEEIMNLTPQERGRYLLRPADAMGQPEGQPGGPDGWPEAAEEWITPAALAARITWIARIVRHFGRRVPDPRGFLDQTLGDLAGPDLQFAVSAAETRAEGLALVLASAEFNRR